MPIALICQDAHTKRWLDCLNRHEPSLYRHSLRVARFATAYSRFHRLGQDLSWSLIEGALLHDLGKTYLPSALLLKPRALNEAEKQMMMLHPVIGAGLLEAQTGDPYSKLVVKIVRHHHERLDGSGYPNGWRQQRTAKAIRVVAICDAFCTMTENKPYENAWPWAMAIARLRSMPEQYDGEIAMHFHEMLKADDLVQELLNAEEDEASKPTRRRKGRGLIHPRGAFYKPLVSGTRS